MISREYFMILNSGQPLCVAFLDLYSIASTKGAKATDLWVRQGDGGA